MKTANPDYTQKTNRTRIFADLTDFHGSNTMYIQHHKINSALAIDL